MKPKTKKGCLIAFIIAMFVFVIIPLIVSICSDGTTTEQSDLKTQKEKVSFEQFAYYQRDKSGDFNYRIFVYITNASPQQMEEHAKKQMWSSRGTTMVCYFNSSEGLNSNAITLAKDVDAALDEIWKPSLVARYMHWPTGKEEFEENPYKE